MSPCLLLGTGGHLSVCSMTTTSHTDSSETLSITAVERETGIGKDTLRVWEKRYGFPNPLRDLADDRRYPMEQVQRLKNIRRLLDAGYRPGKVVGLGDQDIQILLDKINNLSRTNVAAVADGDDLEHWLRCIETHQSMQLREELQRSLMRNGLTAFVHGVVAPLTTAVGEAWAQGRFEVFEEHLYTEVITNVLRSNLEALRQMRGQDTPKVLLTTVPQELHGLGLLMVEALLTLEGCACISLGTQTPLGDIVQAAAAYQADVVALSFTNVLSSSNVHSCLRDLRKALPASMEMWVGGSSMSLYQRPLEGVVASQDLRALSGLVAAWRACHGRKLNV